MGPFFMSRLLARKSDLIISIKEARKLLGVSSRTMTNSEIRALIKDYELLARHAIRDYLVRKR
jgi:hypothetical protein